MTIKEELIALLEAIWNNHDFIVGVISNADTDDKKQKIIDFINYAKQHRVEITSDKILALSIIVK